MQVAVLKETAPRENRVALTPDSVARLVKAKVDVMVQRGAGDRAGFPDQAYEAAGARLATGGYLGHMFELYSYWTWVPIFLAASAAAHSLGGQPPAAVSLLAFGTIAIGGVGCIWGGRIADRIGRERFVIIALAASGACSLLIGLTFGRSWWLLAPVALAWGFFVVADSAQFSVLVTESVPSHAVGTALMIQTSLGFLLTTLTIQMVPPLAAAVGWRWAFVALALGPALGIWTISRLRSVATRPRPPAATV